MEFNIIYKNLEKEKYDREEVKKIFFYECDFTLTTENSKKIRKNYIMLHWCLIR